MSAESNLVGVRAYAEIVREEEVAPRGEPHRHSVDRLELRGNAPPERVARFWMRGEAVDVAAENGNPAEDVDREPGLFLRVHLSCIQRDTRRAIRLPGCVVLPRLTSAARTTRGGG